MDSRLRLCDSPERLCLKGTRANANSFGRREYEMKNFVPITLRQHLDAIDLLCLASMIAVGYVLFTFGPLP